MFEQLIPYGWDSGWQEAFTPYQAQELLPGRVIAEHRQYSIVMTPLGEYIATVSGNLRYRAHSRADYPAVGDWVALSPPGNAERLKIQQVLPRRSKVSRKAAGEHAKEQIIGANLDTLMIMSSLNQDFNPRRLERYLALAQNSDCQPVLILNKLDLCDDLAPYLQELEQIAPHIPRVLISAAEAQGLEQLQPYLKPGHTLALIGSSGVGKSTLLNALSGEEMRVQSIRQQDARGRHTTVHRQLFLLPQAQGLLLDSPGLREIQLWESSGLETAFGDIQTLISHCHFKDCRHDKEPECAVREALNSGILHKKRWRNYLKLSNERLYLEQRKAQMREVEKRIKVKNQYKKARREALYGYLSKR